MAEKRIGVAVTAPDSNTALSAIEDLEKRGFPAAWMTSGSASGGEGYEPTPILRQTWTGPRR